MGGRAAQHAARGIDDPRIAPGRRLDRQALGERTLPGDLAVAPEIGDLGQPLVAGARLDQGDMRIEGLGELARQHGAAPPAAHDDVVEIRFRHCLLTDRALAGTAPPITGASSAAPSR